MNFPYNHEGQRVIAENQQRILSNPVHNRVQESRAHERE